MPGYLKVQSHLNARISNYLFYVRAPMKTLNPLPVTPYDWVNDATSQCMNFLSGSMNQYDGVIRVEQITDTLLSALLTNTMRDDAKKAAYIFIKEKKWANGDDLISCIEDIILDLENVYWDFDPQYIQVVAKKVWYTYKPIIHHVIYHYITTILLTEGFN